MGPQPDLFASSGGGLIDYLEVLSGQAELLAEQRARASPKWGTLSLVQVPLERVCRNVGAIAAAKRL
jgi:hypothetical protein